MSFSQKNGAKAHTIKNSVCCKLIVFGDQTASRKMWPRLPDLNLYDIYMWDMFRDETYRNNPCTEDNVKKIIQDAVPSIHYQNS